MSKFSVSRAKAGDREAIALLSTELSLGDDSDAPYQSPAAWEGHLAREEDTHQIFLVAKSQRETIGYTALQPMVTTTDEGNVSHRGGSLIISAQTVVAPAWRGNGIRALLLRKAFTTAKHLGYERVVGVVAASWVERYQAEGWEAVPEGLGYGLLGKPVPQMLDEAWNFPGAPRHLTIWTARSPFDSYDRAILYRLGGTPDEWFWPESEQGESHGTSWSLQHQVEPLIPSLDDATRIYLARKYRRYGLTVTPGLLPPYVDLDL